MKHGLMPAFGFVAAAVLALGAGLGGAATTAAGPYYANPSWDQQLPASTRFIVLSNWIDADHPSGGAAVLDRETGLVWEQSPSNLRDFLYFTSFVCMTSNTGGRTGWRLPTIQEFMSLVDQSQSNPALPSGHPFTNVQISLTSPHRYWSATTSGINSSGAFTVDFSVGRVEGVDKSNFQDVLTWCVRGGQGVDPQ